MEPFFVSLGAVALGEMGDKTQLLAILLASTFRRPVLIVLGILAATVLNHTAAGYVGTWLAAALGAELLRWLIGVSFIGMAAWVLVPDRIDASTDRATRLGAFGTTVVAFFLAEMGDKTQIATVALAAHYPGALLSVVAGTTTGMLLADVPAVFLGGALAERIPLRVVRGVSAAIFAILGLLTLAKVDQLL